MTIVGFLTWFVNQAVNYIPIEFVIFNIEVWTVTIIYRVLSNEWWFVTAWNKMTGKDKDQPDYEFKITSKGWSFNGKGHNPIETLKKAWSDLTGEGKELPLKDEIKKVMKHQIRKQVISNVYSTINQKSVEEKVVVDGKGQAEKTTPASIMQKHINKIYEQVLSEEFGINAKDEPKKTKRKK